MAQTARNSRGATNIVLNLANKKVVITKSAIYKILKGLTHRGMAAMFCFTFLNLMLHFIILLMSEAVLKDLLCSGKFFSVLL